MKGPLLASAIAALVLALFFRAPLQTSFPWISNLCRHEQEFICKPAQYTTEIVSIDPLLIYINNFVSRSEIDGLITLGTPNLATSLLTYPDGSKRPSKSRTSSSAPIPPSEQLNCILSRAQSFIGASFPPDGDFGTVQMVRYEVGQRFDGHRDWYETPQLVKNEGEGGRKWFNRLASFFVYLEAADVQGGETWFPHIDVNDEGGGEGEGKWRKHEEGGTAFVPREGNALFWVNLFPNGTGDERVVHAGLPLVGGRKTGMNVWARTFYRR